MIKAKVSAKTDNKLPKKFNYFFFYESEQRSDILWYLNQAFIVMILDDVSRFSRRDRRPDDRYKKFRENKLLKMHNDVHLCHLLSSSQWVHPEAQSLTELSVSSCISLAYSIRSKIVGQSNVRAHWALNERSHFWMHPMGASRNATAHWALSELLHLIGLYF